VRKSTLPNGSLVKTVTHSDIVEHSDAEFYHTNHYLSRLREHVRRGQFTCGEAEFRTTDSSAGLPVSVVEAGPSGTTQPGSRNGSQNWSGLQLLALERDKFSKPGFFGSVQAEWVVPNVALPPFNPLVHEGRGQKPPGPQIIIPPGGGPGENGWVSIMKDFGPTAQNSRDFGNVKSSYWVGIDNAGGSGWNQILEEVVSRDWNQINPKNYPILSPKYGLINDPYSYTVTLWQAGVEVDIELKGKNENETQVVSSAWLQVLGPHGTGSEVALDGFTVEPGDLVEVQLYKLPRPSAASGFNGAAYCVFTNWTRTTYMEFAVYCKALLIGGQVEWIVERTGVGNGSPSKGQPPRKGGLAWLPNFGRVCFDAIQCGFAPGRGPDVAFGPSVPSLPQPPLIAFSPGESNPAHYQQGPTEQSDIYGNHLTSTTFNDNLIICEYIYELSLPFGAPLLHGLALEP
jgi:hypothetical protein